MSKVAIKPVDVEIRGTPDPVASLTEFREYLGIGDAPTFDVSLTQHLAAASEFVQGPFSATRRCFTDHNLRAEYASHVFDLELPGGRVKAGTSVGIVSEVGELVTVSRVIAGLKSFYIRTSSPADVAVTLTWTSAHGRIPSPVKEAALRLASHYWVTAGGESEGDTAAESDVRDMLMRSYWA